MGDLLRRRGLMADAEHWVTMRSGFSDYGLYPRSNGSTFSIMDNGAWAQSVSNGQNQNTSGFYLRDLITYADIKDKTCRIVCEFACSGYSSFDEIVSPDEATANLTIGLYNTNPLPNNKNHGSYRTAKSDLTTKATILGRHEYIFVPSEVFAGQTEASYLGWNIGFRSTINGLTLQILQVDFGVKM